VSKAEARTLYLRLREHARSITQANNLDASSFYARFMILEGREIDLVVPVEAELIPRYTTIFTTPLLI